MKLETTIDAEYLSGARGWDAFAGIREVLQNGRDAEVEQGAPLAVRYSAESRTLRVENEGATLPREALLMGRSTKRDNRELAGQWGEGLKLGCLVLVRSGHPVKIRSGPEVWTPAIEASEAFGGRQILTFRIEGGREDRQRVCVEVGNVSPEDWAGVRERFLFLYKRDVPSVETQNGTVLLSEKWKGKVFVKGIFVQHRADLGYGYDLKNVDLDRDRRLIGDYDLKSQLRRIWFEAVESRPDLLGDFASLLESREDKDLAEVASYHASQVPEAAALFVAERFRKRYGADAVPVANLAESRDVEHLGVRGVVTPEPLAAVLSRTVGDLKEVQRSLREEVLEVHSWGELSEQERASLERAVELTCTGVKVGMEEVDVVRFRSKKLWGQYKDGRILISRAILGDRARTLETVVHEAAHRKGGDGDHGHVNEIERIWSAVVESLDGKGTAVGT
jgi:hypothetical protein